MPHGAGSAGWARQFNPPGISAGATCAATSRSCRWAKVEFDRAGVLVEAEHLVESWNPPLARCRHFGVLLDNALCPDNTLSGLALMDERDAARLRGCRAAAVRYPCQNPRGPGD